MRRESRRALNVLLLASLVIAPLTAANAADASKSFVALPDCGSLPKGSVPYSKVGLRDQSNDGVNALSADEHGAQWRLLFDGKSLRGWHGFQRDTLPPAWHVEHGAIAVTKWNEGDPTDDRGDIRTSEAYGDFELRLQWAATPASNSGIFFLAREGVAESVYESAPEMQILDDARHEDGAEPSHRAGGLYGLYAPRCNALRPVGQYNDVRLVLRDGEVEHWLNGYRVLTYRLGTREWREQVARSKFKDMPHFGGARRGYIALQDHGDVIRFRNIRLRAGSTQDAK